MEPLFFSSKFVLTSPINQEEAIAKLSEEVAPAQGPAYWFEKRRQIFEGSVTNDTFRITRIIRYRNDLLPVIHGRVYPQESGSQIQIVMSLHPIALVIVIGLGLAAVWFILTILYPLITTGNFDHSRVRIAVILPSVYIAFTLAFGFEAVIATRLLKRIFAAN
jgi:hypothetical protein